MVAATPLVSVPSLPVMRAFPGDQTLVWRAGHAVTRAALLGDARTLAKRLPEQRFVINTCGDRYNFLVAFLAALLREQVTLLPGDRSQRALMALVEQYPGLYALADASTEGAQLDIVKALLVDAPGEQPADEGVVETIPADRVAVIVFTSGTTGKPTPHAKRWGTLVAKAHLCAQYLSVAMTGTAAPPSVVATVPPQHMYGLELSILVPLHEAVSVYAGQPLLPPEIVSALSSVAAPRFLVTTPYHLRALARARPVLPPLAAVMSATAPLTASLAARIEDLFSTRVVEIYGFTEAGTIATRRTVEGETWYCDPDIRLHGDGDSCVIEAGHLDEPTPIHDNVKRLSPQSFQLRGRGGDVVDVAGKRASLSGLNTILTEVDGVIDGVFFQSSAREVEGVARLVAIVVAPNTGAQAIRDALRAQIDPAFLPRKILHVDALPRSASGKLPREALAEVARKLGLGAA